ncbi:riboflavin synthase [Miltoncostaea marina]|uniref:riboflavin synthase n=1 Tax=Miltoncostaea marina TaxID=2843215 RepID=UPI001C3D61B4|nr:riboflavin synthase [Miltoncostaea marina]
MFTGLVEEGGRVAAVAPGERGARLEIAARTVLEGLEVGDSVAVNGACLTAVEVGAGGFAVDAVAETLRRTALGALAPGDRVNLERPMRLGDRLDGHLVQGHVDGVGTVRAVRPEGESAVLEVAAPPELLRYVVEKGSIAVDGVSLTVAGRLADAFTVALIPHTMSVTTLGPQALGRAVNLEVDVVAKYVESLAAPYAPPAGEVP